MEMLIVTLLQKQIDKIMTIAVICISAAVAGFTLSLSYREKYLSIYSHKIEVLKKLLGELEAIGMWASQEYDDKSHSEAWFDPRVSVNLPPSDETYQFHWERSFAIFGRKIFKKLKHLAYSLMAFSSYLDIPRRHIDGNVLLTTSIIKKMQDEAQRTNQRVFNPCKIQGENKLTEEEASFIIELYNLNKCVHVEGIGNKKHPESLHSTFTNAIEYVKATFRKLKESRSFLFTFWTINFLSIIIGIIGLIFLFLFFYLGVPLVKQFIIGS